MRLMCDEKEMEVWSGAVTLECPDGEHLSISRLHMRQADDAALWFVCISLDGMLGLYISVSDGVRSETNSVGCESFPRKDF